MSSSSSSVRSVRKAVENNNAGRIDSAQDKRIRLDSSDDQHQQCRRRQRRSSRPRSSRPRCNRPRCGRARGRAPPRGSRRRGPRFRSARRAPHDLRGRSSRRGGVRRGRGPPRCRRSQRSQCAQTHRIQSQARPTLPHNGIWPRRDDSAHRRYVDLRPRAGRVVTNPDMERTRTWARALHRRVRSVLGLRVIVASPRLRSRDRRRAAAAHVIAPPAHRRIFCPPPCLPRGRPSSSCVAGGRRRAAAAHVIAPPAHRRIFCPPPCLLRGRPSSSRRIISIFAAAAVDRRSRTAASGCVVTTHDVIAYEPYVDGRQDARAGKRALRPPAHPRTARPTLPHNGIWPRRDDSAHHRVGVLRRPSPTRRSHTKPWHELISASSRRPRLKRGCTCGVFIVPCLPAGFGSLRCARHHVLSAGGAFPLTYCASNDKNRIRNAIDVGCPRANV